MVPPPDIPGDEFPDFENMSLEEQMAWLESLAKRQGAKEDEFLTDADLDIPIPENAVIDEPGYVPYSISEKPVEQAADAREEIEEVEAVEDEIEPEVESVADEFEAVPEGASDPMQWLDTLSVQTGEDVPGTVDELAEMAELGDDRFFEEFDAVEEPADEQPAFEPEQFDEAEAVSGWDEEVADAGEPEPAVSWADLESSEEFDLGSLLGEEDEFEDDLGSIVADEEDAEAWLADLAEPQDAGAGEAFPLGELQAEAGDDQPVESATPFDSEPPEETWAAEADVDLEPRPEDAVQAGLAGQPDVEDDMAVLAGADPMAWLETLAKRQGAKIEELTTAADLEIPELPEDTVVDEPGYVEYSPFELLSRDEEIDLDAGATEEAEGQPEREEIEALGELGMMDESLSWLSDLVTEPDADVASVLAVEGGAEDFAAAEAPVVETPVEDPLGDMTDEEIAYAQAHGQLTGEQELAWLKRQAAKLAEARRSEEEAMGELADELEPAEPAELPPWLAEMRSDSLLDEDAIEEEAASLDVADLEELLDQGVIEDFELEDASVPESELEAFLSGDFVPEEPDDLAEALDAEYDRRLAQDDSEPEWYAQAVAQVEATASEAEEAFVEAVPVDMPDWLTMDDQEPEQASEEEIPGWLTEPIQAEAEAEPAEVPAWLAEMSQEPVDEEIEWEPAPDLPEFADQAARETPVEPSPEVMARAAESIPPTELFDTYRRRLEADPTDFVNRLGLARALYANRELAPSMDQYEALVDNAQLLEDVSNDLVRLVDEHPQTPRVRRLLGDTYMQQGRLQDALDAYRSALDLL